MPVLFVAQGSFGTGSWAVGGQVPCEAAQCFAREAVQSVQFSASALGLGWRKIP